MRQLTTIRTILNESDNKFIGTSKPHGRVTVEEDWQLTTTSNVYGKLENGPYRWWARDDVAPTETEVPNIESISINRSLDQDAATCTIVISNQLMLSNNTSPINSTDFGQPGYYGYNYGNAPDAQSLWGHSENSWKNVLVPNALLRTYQGYGGYTETNGKLVPDTISTAVTNGNLVMTGVWLVDTVSLGTNGKLRLQCRDMAKLLIEQMVFPPLVPERLYPPKYFRFVYEDVPAAPPDDPAPNPDPIEANLVYSDSTVERWLGTGALVNTAPDAFNRDESRGSISHGWRYWNNDYAKDWWEATVNGEINQVYINAIGAPPGGNYFAWISVKEGGTWQGTNTITYDGDDPGSNIQIYHPEKPSLGTDIKYVVAVAVPPAASVNLDEKDGIWVDLPRTYDAQALRVTIASTWYSPWGPNHYRSGVGAIRARLVNEDPVTSEPSVQTSETTIQKDGNIKDWVDPVKEMLMWSGFLLYQGESNISDPGPYGVIETSGTYPVDMLREDLFDKKNVMDVITSIKEVLGYIFYIDEEGGVQFHSPNWWALGNTLDDGTRVNYIHEIYDTNTLTDYTANFTDNDVRSEIIIGSDLEVEEANQTQYVTFDPRAVQPSGAPDLVRGMVRPAIWINEVWTNSEEQRLMAALIALHIMFNSRQGNVTIVANPEIQINDQVRIYERTSSESWVHYVRSINSEMNLETGSYTMSLGTNWLGEQEVWAFDRNTLLAIENRRKESPNESRRTDYNNAYEEWRADENVWTQDFKILPLAEPTRTHGEGGTWRVAVVGPPEPINNNGTAEANMDVDVVSTFNQVAAYAEVRVEYIFSQNTVPTGYDVIYITRQASNADINNWGSLANITTPIIHGRPDNWDDGEISNAASSSVNATNIDAQTNAAFEIAGAPGTVTFGDGDTVTTNGVPTANMLTGYISVGEAVAGGEIVIAAIPSGTTYQDSNNSTVKHVMWGTDIADVDAYAQVVWETLGDAILWTRS